MRTHPTDLNSFRCIVSALALLTVICMPSPSLAAEQSAGGLNVLKARFFDADSRVLPNEKARQLAKTATFIATYDSVPADVEIPFEYALDLWATSISSPVPILVDVQWQSLGQGVLGAAGASFIHRDFDAAPSEGVWYVDALADALAGADQSPGSADVVVILNSDISWYLGTDGNVPAGAFDLVTVALHEMAHGLGFSSSFDVTNGSGSWGFGTARPMAFDSWVSDGAGHALVDVGNFTNPSNELGATLESGALSFSGPRATAAHGGVSPRLYSPLPWLDGLSLSHLDEAAFPTGDPSSLMTPFLAASEAIHDPGEVTLCMLEDIGWQTSCAELPSGTCLSDPQTLCLDGQPGDRRFRLTLQYETALGGGFSGAGQVLPLAQVGQPHGGTIAFVSLENPEMLVKVLNGCEINGHYWVFYGAATNIGFELKVEDTVSGEERVFSNPDLHPADPVTSTDAFATCP